jgi:CDP-diacylglycerol--glycerol-3-phosphate 3-phosphatidyltransferase
VSDSTRESTDELNPQAESSGLSIASWANAITTGRLLLSPVMFWVIPNHPRGSWIAVGLWFVLGISDAIDGYVARRRGPTPAGAFLDPLADKVLVLGAMFTLVSTGVFWLVPVVIIAARELIISVYRVILTAKGISVPATKMAKYKTFFQQLSIGFVLLPWTAVDAVWLWKGLLWAAVALALISGGRYLYYARQSQSATHPQPAVG